MRGFRSISCRRRCDISHRGRRRTVPGGFALGIGFLFHPLAVPWAPWITLWLAGRAFKDTPTRSAGIRAAATASVGYAIGIAVLALPWMLAGKFMPHLPDTPFA